jgi:anti-sigma factor RsiW
MHEIIKQHIVSAEIEKIGVVSTFFSLLLPKLVTTAPACGVLTAALAGGLLMAALAGGLLMAALADGLLMAALADRIAAGDSVTGETYKL